MRLSGNRELPGSAEEAGGWMKGHHLSEGRLAPPRARTKWGATSPFSPLLPSQLSPGFLWAEPPREMMQGK